MQSDKKAELEAKVANRQADIQKFDQGFLSTTQATDEQSLLKVKTAFIIAFKWLYIAIMDKYRNEYENAKGSARKRLLNPDSLNTNERTLVHKLNTIQFKDSLQDSYQDFDSRYIGETFSLVEKFLAEDNLEKDPRNQELSCLTTALDKVYFIEISGVCHSLQEKQRNISELFLQSARGNHPLVKETLKRNFVALLELIDKTHALSQKTKAPLNQEKQQYQNANLVLALPENLFNQTEIKEFLALLDNVKQLTLSNLSTSNQEQQAQSQIPVSRYNFALHYCDAATLIEVFNELQILKQPCINERFLVFRDFNAKITEFSDLVMRSLDEIRSKLKTCDDKSLYTLYADLTYWRWAVEFLINYNLGETTFSQNMNSASTIVKDVIGAIAARVEKPLKAINEDLKRLSSNPVTADLVKKSFELNSKQLELLTAMSTANIKEQAIIDLVSRYFQLYHAALAVMVVARIQALDTMYEELYKSFENTQSADALRQLLIQNKRIFDQECEIHSALTALCNVHNFQALESYNDKVDKMKRCRQEIEYKIEDIARSTARNNLQGVIGLLKQMIDGQNIVVHDFTRSFNLLYIKVEQYHAVEASVQEQKVPDLFDGFIASLLPENFYQVESLKNPAVQPISHLQYQTIKRVIEAVKGSSYAQRDVVKRNIDAFNTAEAELKAHIAQFRQRLTETGKAIQACKTENYPDALKQLMEDNQYIVENFLGADPTDKEVNVTHFLRELMKGELELHIRNAQALVKKKEAFEKAYDAQIQAEADKIIQVVGAATLEKELDDQAISQHFLKINLLWEKCAKEGLVAPTQGFISKFEVIQDLIDRSLVPRKQSLQTLLQGKPESIDEQFIEKMQQKLAAEKSHLEKLVLVCSQFPESICNLERLGVCLQEYREAISTFETEVIDLEFKRVFTQKILDLEKQDRESLIALDDIQKQALIHTLESMNQIIVLRKNTHSLEGDPLVERAMKILRTMNEFLDHYYQECSTKALDWLRSVPKNIDDMRAIAVKFTQRVDYLVDLHKKVSDLAQTFGIGMWENKLTAKTLGDYLGLQTEPEMLYQGNLNLIALEKWEMINQIFADCQNYTYTARLWTTPTGINELLSLKKRWNQLGNQQLTNLDYYFARVKKIIGDRLEENQNNETEKRTTETHNFYSECLGNMAKLQTKQKNQWIAVIKAALDLNNFAQAQSALVKLRPAQEELVSYWVNLTAAIFQKVCTVDMADQESDKHIFDALRAAKRELLERPLVDQIKFYDDLLVKVNAQQSYDATRIKQILILARTFEDAHDPDREDHAWFGRATGVDEIVNEMPSPVNFLSELSAKSSTTGTVWQWVDQLIQQLVGIVSSRLVLTKEQSSRHEETQKFYVDTNNVCAAYFPSSTKIYVETHSKKKNSASEKHDVELDRVEVRQQVVH
ncbi:MAG: hypothetical protein K2X50_02110 [Gammaproteobacteria bacterium]|nr:hypothetical protein [Gammaproteobacteria bacterium]